jgi:hypothetical protein
VVLSPPKVGRKINCRPTMKLLLAKRLVQNGRKAHASLAQLSRYVRSSGGDILVGQAVGAARRRLGELPIGIVLGDFERLLCPVRG